MTSSRSLGVGVDCGFCVKAGALKGAIRAADTKMRSLDCGSAIDARLLIRLLLLLTDFDCAVAGGFNTGFPPPSPCS